MAKRKHNYQDPKWDRIMTLSQLKKLWHIVRNTKDASVKKQTLKQIEKLQHFLEKLPLDPQRQSSLPLRGYRQSFT